MPCCGRHPGPALGPAPLPPGRRGQLQRRAIASWAGQACCGRALIICLQEGEIPTNPGARPRQLPNLQPLKLEQLPAADPTANSSACMLECSTDSQRTAGRQHTRQRIYHAAAAAAPTATTGSQCRAAGTHAHQVPQRLLQVNRALQQWAAVPLNHTPDLGQLRLLRLLPLQLRNKKQNE